MNKHNTAIHLSDIQAASHRIRPEAIVTPLLESPQINQALGGRVLFKAEVLQKTGSFKFRGAMNFLRQVKAAEGVRHVVAYSSGNHAQAVAATAQMLGLKATIVMPEDAPAMKIEGTRFYGAEVVLYNRRTESREEMAHRLVVQYKAVLVPPYDHPFTIAGQGTVGLELVEQAQALETSLDAVFVPCSGGGLTAGCALAVKTMSPQTHVYSVEPEGFEDTARSLAQGQRVSIDAIGNNTLCDALMMPQPGVVTFPINARYVTRGLSVSDDAVYKAMAMMFQHLKLVVEPGGAVGLAALLSGQWDCQGKTVAIILSGGNVDPQVFMQALHPLAKDTPMTLST